MKILKILCALVLLITQAVASNSCDMQQVAENIVTNLYEVMGDKTRRQPSIEISSKKDAGARFEGRNNTIVLEEKLYHICTKFGKDSLSALAFVLGHELGHFYHRNKGESYLAQHRHVHADIEEEYSADVHGVFNAYLAGYKTVNIIPDLIDQIYESYHLKGVNLHGYPSLEERKSISEEVLDDVNKLIHTFELANYLAVIGEYKYAAAAYEFILTSYKGREIYNNLGVVYLLETLNFTENNYNQYLYPIEIDSRSRLKKPKTQEGGKDLDPQQQRYILMLLQKAIVQFDKASKLDPNYIIDDVNKVCALLLLGKADEANQHYNRKIDNKIPFFKADETIFANARLAKALILMALDENAAAARIWTNLAQHPNKVIANQANYNLSVIRQGRTRTLAIAEDCFSRNSIDGIHLHTITTDKSFALNNKIRMSIIPKSESVVYILKTVSNKSLVFQRVFGAMTLNSNLKTALPSISTAMGFYMFCPEGKTVGLVDRKGQLLEWGQYSRTGI